MRPIDAYDILREPVVTEKSTILASANKYVFKVKIDATKSQVKQAVEKVFNVKVDKVNTLRVKGKTRNFKGREGKLKDYKKSIVTLAEGNTINLGVK
jgi:large subunit ribosomal protein L23